ncbi:MAG: protein jag [Clostridia bacterium]|nr:protein jag [Clostridia bacterium]
MKNEVTVSAKSIEEAVAKGAQQLGVSAEEVKYEVVEEGKRGFLGIGSTDAQVKVTYVFSPLAAAKKFAETLIADLELDATVAIHDDGDGEALMTISGEDSSELIGHHGDTLDAFQYLVNLAANKKETEDRKYTRVSVDIENYREKREQTLRQLARRMVAKAKKYKKSVSLEPMSSYERRIIHSEVQTIEGVSTKSVGAEGCRRVVIFLDGAEVPTEENVKVMENSNSNKSKGSKGGKQRKHDNKEAAAPSIKRSDLPYHEPRKIEKAKDLDSYFEKLKEFSSTFDQ